MLMIAFQRLGVQVLRKMLGVANDTPRRDRERICTRRFAKVHASEKKGSQGL